MKTIIWNAYIMYDPETNEKIGVYASKSEATQDCPGWKDEGYVIAPCRIVCERKK